ncbi:MAG: transposase IS200-family protein [Bacteroidetes bacterium]|nr:transposase IS200-family protein [Bacteroidota bacterium]
MFSTKNREPFIGHDIEDRIWSYIGGIARENGMTALCIRGFPDHIHILSTITKTMTVSQALQFLKGGSSKWIHETLPRTIPFAWQDGYAAFTVSESDIPRIIEYIKRQREHHRKRSFQEEYLEFLREHHIEFDEKYVWG